jgi:putative FmdB family regulatory protein
MPTYDYVCRACGHEFERFQRISEGSLRKCPECGELKLRRLMGAGAGIIFKGSGFYETDYKRKGPNGKAGTASSTSAGSGNKETSKGDSAPAKTESVKGGKKDD